MHLQAWALIVASRYHRSQKSEAWCKADMILTAGFLSVVYTAVSLIAHMCYQR